MKSKQIIIVFMAGIMLITSCHDSFLTERVYSNITPLNFYKTEKDAQAALVSVYNVMRSANAFQRQIILAAECPGEASWPNNSGEAWRTELDQFTWTASSPGFRQVWAELYVMVNRANTVLYYIDNIEFTTPGMKEQIVAEIRFLRGVAYFYLIRFFDNIPLMTEENMNDLYVSNVGTGETVWSFIFSDFEYAKAHLKSKYSGADVGRPTAGAAQTMLTKAYLSYAGKPWNKTEYWSKAAQEAKSVLDNSQYGYALESDYGKVFSVNNEHGSEYIFSVEYESKISNGWDFPTFTGIRSGDQIRLDGWSSLTVEEEFFNSMSEEDKRRSKSFVLSYQGVQKPDITWTYPGNISIPHYNKYIDPSDSEASGTNDYAINFYLARFSDLLLMHSEAENELNGPNESALYGINLVRERAGLSLLKAADYTIESLRDAIFQERLWELCCEGHTWFDMKRMDLMKKRITKYKVEDKHYVFPIPQNEMDVNPELVQNNGYQ